MKTISQENVINLQFSKFGTVLIPDQYSYPNEFCIHTDSLDEAMDIATQFPINKATGNTSPYFESFLNRTITPKGSDVVKEALTQTGAFLIKQEISVIGGVTGYEAIFVVKKIEGGAFKAEQICGKIFGFHLPYSKLYVKKIEKGILYYEKITDENKEDYLQTHRI